MDAKNVLENQSIVSSLNYDCLCQVFQRLDIDDCMNLVEAYAELQSVADWMFKTKFHKVTIDFDTPVDIDRFLHHIGPFVQSMQLMLFDKLSYTVEDLVKIQKTCKQLKSLQLIGFERGDDDENNPFCAAADKLEALTLGHCYLANDDDNFFKCFTNLKSLNMVECADISNIAMEKCFQNNQGITSFVCHTHNLIDPKLLQLLPNLERLGLRCNADNADLSCLSKLKSLRSVALHCQNGTVTTALNQLALKIDLEELELSNVCIDGDTFKIIKSFRKLQRLVVTTPNNNNYEFRSSENELPLTLKTFKLEGFHISLRQIEQLVKQREHLENIHLADCILNTNRSFDSIANSLVRKMNLDTNRTVNLTLTCDATSSKVNC